MITVFFLSFLLLNMDCGVLTSVVAWAFTALKKKTQFLSAQDTYYIVQ